MSFFCLDASTSTLLNRLVKPFFFALFLLHLLLVFEDLLRCELEDVGFRETVLTDGSEEILICV